MKRGQFDFVWMFAILAGGAILFLAIYGALQFGDTSRHQTDTEIAKKISVITDPLQAGFSEGSFGKIIFRQETRVNNLCTPGDYGENEISIATRSDVGKEWNLPGESVSVTNKYIFSSEQNSGTDYYVFSKPFHFPYKVSDMIFLTPSHYCFFGAPNKIADDITSLSVPNIEVDNCSLDDAVRVCFGSGSDCDIYVYGSCSSGCESFYDTGTVVKASGDMKYVGNLMYAAIFSEEYLYNCNVNRLMQRASQIAEELVYKTDLMSARGCNTNMKSDLIAWSSAVASATESNIESLYIIGESMENKNNRELCNVWED